jgi:hypothetical protein
MHIGKSLVLAGCLACTAVSSVAFAVPAVLQDDKEAIKAEFEKKKAELDENDAEAVFALAMWADANGLRTDSKRLLRKVIKVDENHKEARELLGYVLYEDRWVTKREQERLERKKEEEEMEAKGFRRWRDEWVPTADYEKYEQGLVPVEQEGQTKWVTPEDKERIEKGMFLYKSQWITPDQKEKLDAGYFFVNGDFVDEETANKLHDDVTNMWDFERDYVKLKTTCNYDFADAAMTHADRAIGQAYKILGVPAPEGDEFVKADLIMVKETTDYQQLGDGIQDNNDANMSSVYETFSFIDPNTGRVRGVAKFTVLDEGNPDGNENYSRMILRHCAVDTAMRNLGYNEQMPRWFQLGLATYCGRYWDPMHNDGVTLLGSWSVNALQREGGLIKLSNFFDSFAVSKQSVLQTGLIVSFLNHSQELPKKLSDQWAKVLESLKAGEGDDIQKAFVKLEIQLATKDAQKAFEAYADQLLKG